MVSTIPVTGLKRLGLTRLLTIIYIFVSIKITVAFPACKLSKQLKWYLLTYVNIFHCKNMAPYVYMKKLQMTEFAHNPTEME